MRILSELTGILEFVNSPAEVGIFSGVLIDDYVVLTLLDDGFAIFGG